MWKKTTLALLAGAALAVTMLQPASAQYQNPDCTPVQLNGNLNPGMPPNWVHDPVTQAWLAPDSPQARNVYQRSQACLGSQGYNYGQQRADQNWYRGNGQRYGYNNYGNNSGYGYNDYGNNSGYGYNYRGR